MNSTPSPQLKELDFPAARSFFRSLFQADWQETYPIWQEAITKGSLEWSFNADKLRKIVAELDTLLTYPPSAIAPWLPKICSGLPGGSPDQALTTLEFLAQVRTIVEQMAAEWEMKGKPQRQGA